MVSMLGRGTLVLVTDARYSALMIKAWPRVASSASMHNPNRVISKDVKICTCYSYDRYATLIVRLGRNALAPTRRNSLKCTVRFSRQESYNQRVDCLLLYFVVWPRLMSLVPCCGQDSYQAQDPQHPIDSSNIKLSLLFSNDIPFSICVIC